MFYRGKKVLVTGGTGFVGSHLVRALVAAGARVRVPVHRREPPERVPDVEYISADLHAPADCERVCAGAEFLFHAAGSVGAAGVGAEGAMASITTNLVLTAQVLQAAWKQRVQRALIFSSSTAYPPAEHAVREDELWQGPPFAGYFGYGWMRRYLERLSQYVAGNSALQIALVRPTAVYGPGDNFDPHTSHVIPGLIRRAVQREDPFEIWGDGSEVRDFLHVDDLARGCLLMLEQHATCDAVNLGYGRGASIAEVVEIVLRAAGHANARRVFNAERPSALPFRLVDTSKAQAVLGFSPQITLEQGITDTVRWYAACCSQSKQ